MVKRRAPEAQRQPTDNDGELDFATSQESNGSDEQQQALIQTLEKHYAAALEKMKVQKEKKFLDVAQKQLNHEVVASAKDVGDCVKAAEEVYSAFVRDYAACEDRIRKKWVQMEQEQENLMKMVGTRYKKDQDTIKDASSSHLAGLSKTRSTCLEYQSIIDRLVFRGQEEDDKE